MLFVHPRKTQTQIHQIDQPEIRCHVEIGTRSTNRMQQRNMPDQVWRRERPIRLSESKGLLSRRCVRIQTFRNHHDVLIFKPRVRRHLTLGLPRSFVQKPTNPTKTPTSSPPPSHPAPRTSSSEYSTATAATATNAPNSRGTCCPRSSPKPSYNLVSPEKNPPRRSCKTSSPRVTSSAIGGCTPVGPWTIRFRGPRPYPCICTGGGIGSPSAMWGIVGRWWDGGGRKPMDRPAGEEALPCLRWPGRQIPH